MFHLSIGRRNILIKFAQKIFRINQIEILFVKNIMGSMNAKPQKYNITSFALAIGANDYAGVQKFIDTCDTFYSYSDSRNLKTILYKAPLAFLQNLRPESIIYAAITCDRADYVEYIAKTRPEVLSEPDSNDIYPIHAFTYNVYKYNNLSLLKKCLMAGMEVNERDKDIGHTLLASIVFQTINEPIALDEPCMTPNIIQLLIEFGADPFIKNVNGQTIFDYISVSIQKFEYTIASQDDAKWRRHLKAYQDEYRSWPKLIYDCLNKRIGNAMLAVMTTGYFLIIPRDIRFYIAEFNHEYPEI